MIEKICGVVSNCGPNGTPLACGFADGHDGYHSWAAIPPWWHTDNSNIGLSPLSDRELTALKLERLNKYTFNAETWLVKRLLVTLDMLQKEAEAKSQQLSLAVRDIERLMDERDRLRAENVAWRWQP